MTYEIYDNPPRIKCLECDRTSYNLNDVQQRYCSCCSKFHDDKREALGRETEDSTQGASPIVYTFQKLSQKQLQQWIDDLEKMKESEERRPMSE